MVEVLSSRPLLLSERYPGQPELHNALGQMISQEAGEIDRTYGDFIDIKRLEKAVLLAKFLTDEEYADVYSEVELNVIELKLGKKANAIIGVFEPWLRYQALSGSEAVMLNVYKAPIFRLGVLAASTKEEAKQKIRHELIHALHDQRKVIKQENPALIIGGIVEFKMGFRSGCPILVLENMFIYEAVTEALAFKVDNPDFEIEIGPPDTAPSLGVELMSGIHIISKKDLNEPSVLEKMYFLGEIGLFKKAVNYLLKSARGYEDTLTQLNDIQECVLGVKGGKSREELEKTLTRFWYSRVFGLTQTEIDVRFGFD